MKNMYFGDVNDYQKYGLLRILANKGQYKIGVCWMLTIDDGHTDGKFIAYLDQPQRWRQYDPALFDSLRNSIVSGRNRNVALAKNLNILAGAKFYDSFITDLRDNRAMYFNEMRVTLSECELIFFDPDNGIEIRSIAKGRRNSSKYIYWDEIIDAYKTGHSVLVYQHFPREKRSTFCKRMVREMQTRLNSHAVYCFRTPRVVYFLGVSEKHANHMADRVERISQQWHGKI